VLDSVRARLTLWYVAMLGVVLIAFSAGAYIVLARSLYDRIDARLASTLQATVAVLQYPATASEKNVQTIADALGHLRFPNQTIAILDAGSQVVARKTAPGGPPLRLPPLPLNFSSGIRFFELPESEADADDSCRGVFQRATNGSAAYVYSVVVVASLEPLEDQLDLLQNFLFFVVPLCLILAGLGAWFLIRKSLAPVVTMSERAQRISVENLDQRLLITDPNDEFGRLATTFNALLARLSNSFTRQTQFMADASHELRTPLSVIRTTSTVLLQREDREKSEYREAFTIVEQEARRLTRIVEDMFMLARADAGHPTLQTAKFYLNELLAEAARGAAVLASRKNLHFEALPLGNEAPFCGDEALLRQMMWNLLDNAIRHTPAGGRVQIGLESRDSEYVIAVTDTGCGIRPEARPHVFERFYRAEGARSYAEIDMGSGAGLGLPIARWIAEAHHGGLELQRSDETGTTFVVFLPHP